MSVPTIVRSSQAEYKPAALGRRSIDTTTRRETAIGGRVSQATGGGHRWSAPGAVGTSRRPRSTGHAAADGGAAHASSPDDGGLRVYGQSAGVVARRVVGNRLMPHCFAPTLIIFPGASLMDIKRLADGVTLVPQ